MLTPMVVPSGAALATASVPMLPLAPGLLSMTNGWPSFFCKWSAIRRATTSGVEPAPNGTTIFTGLVGQSCAAAGRAARKSAEQGNDNLHVDFSSS